LDTDFPDAKLLFPFPLSQTLAFRPTNFLSAEQASLSGADSLDTLSETKEHLTLS